MDKGRSSFWMPLALVLVPKMGLSSCKWRWLVLRDQVFSAIPQQSPAPTLPTVRGSPQLREEHMVGHSIYSPFEDLSGMFISPQYVHTVLGFWTSASNSRSRPYYALENQASAQVYFTQLIHSQMNYFQFTVTGVFSWDKVMDFLKTS